MLSSHNLIKGLWIIVVDILVYARLEPLEQFLLNLLLNIGGNEGLLFPDPIPALGFLLDGDYLLFAFEPHLPHPNEHLPELGEPLLALMNHKLRPIHKVLVDLLEGLLVVLVELDLLPQLVRGVGALCCLHV